MRSLKISLFTAMMMVLLPACAQDDLEPDPEDIEDLAGSLEPSSEPPPPPPPPPCIEDACNGLDPDDTGCGASAVTLDECQVTRLDGWVIGKAELRYSYGCGTKWSRATTDIANATTLRAIVVRSDGLTYQDTVHTPQAGEYQVWSPMVYEPTGAPNSGRARARVGDPVDGNRVCHTASIQ